MSFTSCCARYVAISGEKRRSPRAAAAHRSRAWSLRKTKSSLASSRGTRGGRSARRLRVRLLRRADHGHHPRWAVRWEPGGADFAVCVAALACAGASAAAHAGGPTTTERHDHGRRRRAVASSSSSPREPRPTEAGRDCSSFPRSRCTRRRNVLRHCRLRVGLVRRAGPVVIRGLVRSRGDARRPGRPGDLRLAGARPEVSDTQIGAYGVDLGGAEVWAAAVAGLPFKAIVVGDTWSSLGRALKPTGVLNATLFDFLTAGGGPAPCNTTPGIAARSYRGQPPRSPSRR